MLDLFRSGLRKYNDDKNQAAVPLVPCPLRVRRRILEDVKCLCNALRATYESTTDGHSYQDHPLLFPRAGELNPADVIAEMERASNDLVRKHMWLDATHTKLNCKTCSGPFLRDARKRISNALEHDAEEKRRLVMTELELQREESQARFFDDDNDDDEQDLESDDGYDPENPFVSHSHRVKMRGVPPQVLPSVPGKCIAVQAGRRILFKHRDDFDGYFHGPTHEELHPVRLGPMSSALHLPVPSLQSKPAFWTLWGDNGYRIQTGFHYPRIAYEPLPEHVIKSLILPLPDPSLPEDISFPPRTASVSDHEHLVYKAVSLRQFLDTCEPLVSDGTGLPALTGVGPDGSRLCLDLNASTVPIAPHDLSYSVDIDSILMIFYHIKLSSPIKIHTTPQLGIHSDNHLEIDIVYPWTDEEKYTDTPERRYDNIKAIPVGQCPMMLFAKLDHFYFYLAFPHMRHKKPDINRWERTLPWDVQDVIFKHVLPLALQMVAAGDPTLQAYLNPPLDNTPKTITLQAHHWDSLLHYMREIIDKSISEPDCGPDLEAFQGFFLYVDARGIKLATHTIVPGRDRYMHLDSATLIRKVFRDFDFGYIIKQEHGHVSVDSALVIAPNNPGDRSDRFTEVTGLFHLPSLLSSCKQTGGTCKVQPACTSSTYGGMTSTIERTRRDVCHISKSIHYLLAFEPVRDRPGQVDFATAKDQYQCNDVFLEKTDGVVTNLNHAQHCQHGVRIEYRTSLQVAAHVLDALREKVNRRPSAAFS